MSKEKVEKKSSVTKIKSSVLTTWNLQLNIRKERQNIGGSVIFDILVRPKVGSPFLTEIVAAAGCPETKSTSEKT